MPSQLLLGIDAVIFDMDGLLLDSERIALNVFNQTCAHFGLPEQFDLFKQMIGTNHQLGRQILTQGLQGQVDSVAFIAHCDALYQEATLSRPIPLRPGALELLQWLKQKGLPAAVATSSASAKANHKLTAAGIIDFFVTVTGGDQVKNSKPAPDIFLHAAHSIQANPQRCLALEDSDNGVRAAVAAGMKVIQVPDLVPPSADLLSLGHQVHTSLAQVKLHLI
jgi:HAD superfamily hydrolase (TIGR01509 family)